MPIKVLHIITKLEFGGAQSNTLYTVAHLDRFFFDAKLAAGPGGRLDAKVPPGGAVYVPRLARSIRPVRDLLALLELWVLIRKERPSIVHTHSSKAGIIGRLAARLAGVPVIIHTFHGFGFHERQHPVKRRSFVMLEKLCASFSDALIFVSKANMAYARAYAVGDERKHVLIRSGIPLSAYPALPARGTGAAKKRRELGVPEDSVLVVSVGNLKPQKNAEHFIEAAARLAGSRGDPVFMFVGGGEGLEAARAAAKRRGLDRRLLFPGWREDTAEILAAADIFALTSLWEGLPKSLVEAMRTGLPSVCYRTDGVSDILRDGYNGRAADPGDLDSFCSRMKELIEDADLRSAMAAAAASTDLSEFDIDRMVRGQETLYLALMRRKGLRP